MFINKVILYGNITRDPELKSLPSGTSVCNFSVATNRVYKANGERKQDVEYHNVVCFGKTAENVDQYMRKGSSIFVEGRIQTRSWEAKEGGKRYRTEIVAEQVQFGPRKAGKEQEESKESEYPAEEAEIGSDEVEY